MAITIDEAKKVLSEWYPDCVPALHPKFPEAVKLGAEALKRVSAMRKGYRDRETDLLPGETEE